MISKILFLLCVFGLGGVAPCWAQTQPPAPQPPNTNLSPVPSGVIPLPQGPPPTGLQTPVPAPALPGPNAQHPLLVSPGMAQLNAYLQNRPLTLNDAVAVALATNRAFATSVSTLLRAQGRTEEARAALNPTFGLNAVLTEYDQPTNASFGTQSIPILPQFNPILTAQATLPLDLGGTLRAATSQAQFSEVAARIDVNRTRNQIVLNVKNAFYNVLRAQAQIQVAVDTVNNALNRLDAAQKNFAAGISPRFDIFTSQTDVANAQQGLIQARSQLSLSLALLKNAIGLDIKTPLRVTDAGAVETPPGVTPPAVPPPTPVPPIPGGIVPDKPVPVETAPPMPAPPINRNLALPNEVTQAPPPGVVADTLDLGPEFDNLLQEALRTRPEIYEADATIAAARRGITVARRSTLPEVSVGLGYTYSPDAVGFTRAHVGAATLNVNVPLFDGGLARARVKEAQADVATAETNRRNAVDQVGVDVQQAYLTLLQARDRVQVANVGLAQAREAARVAQVRYNAGVSQQVGVSPILELSTAQTSLTQAETNQVNALYDYNNARSQLDWAVGRYSYVGSGPGYPTPPPPKVTGSGTNSPARP